MRAEALALYVVTDPDLVGSRSLIEVCGAALEGGARILQLRDKGASTRSLIEQARALVALCRAHGAQLLVNDRVDVALAARADGAHLGQDDMPVAQARRILGPEAILGASVQTAEEALQAQSDGVDYLAANGVFLTPTKPDLKGAIGLEGIRTLRQASGLPLVAIGGLHAGNAAEAIAAGADGVAVVSAVMSAPDPAAACRELLGAVERGKEMRLGRAREAR